MIRRAPRTPGVPAQTIHCAPWLPGAPPTRCASSSLGVPPQTIHCAPWLSGGAAHLISYASWSSGDHRLSGPPYVVVPWWSLPVRSAVRCVPMVGACGQSPSARVARGSPPVRSAMLLGPRWSLPASSAMRLGPPVVATRQLRCARGLCPQVRRARRPGVAARQLRRAPRSPGATATLPKPPRVISGHTACPKLCTSLGTSTEWYKIVRPARFSRR